MSGHKPPTAPCRDRSRSPAEPAEPMDVEHEGRVVAQAVANERVAAAVAALAEEIALAEAENSAVPTTPTGAPAMSDGAPPAVGGASTGAPAMSHGAPAAVGGAPAVGGARVPTTPTGAPEGMNDVASAVASAGSSSSTTSTTSSTSEPLPEHAIADPPAAAAAPPVAAPAVPWPAGLEVYQVRTTGAMQELRQQTNKQR
jgi:hypothetical protein